MIEAAIVGMGRWGQTLVDSVQNRNDAGIRFIAGSTGRPERAAEWAARQGVKILPDLAAILAEPRVKAVVIASPHQMHADQVIAAARAGKHVFVEKPFTMTKASAEASVAACRQAGVVMALGHNRRFLPAVAEIKKLIAAGALGTLLHVEGQFSGPGALSYQPGMWRTDAHESPLGGMGGMGIHMIDMMINLAGPIAEVTVRSVARALTNGEGEAWVKDFPKTDIEHAELAAFAATITGGPAYPLPLEEAIHGVAVFEAMIGAAASGSTYRVA